MDTTPAGDGAVPSDLAHAAQSPKFRKLVSDRRRFVGIATAAFCFWFLSFVALAAYAPGLMGSSVYQGLTFGYVFGLSQFVMVWVLTVIYVRRANRDFDPLERELREEFGGVRPSHPAAEGGSR